MADSYLMHGNPALPSQGSDEPGAHDVRSSTRAYGTPPVPPHRREIIFDIETTGLDPAEGHRICEIGCVEMINGKVTGRERHFYFNPDRTMPSEALAIHKLSDAFLADKPRFHEKVDELTAFIGDTRLVAHNARFDLAHLNAELGICGRPGIPADRTIDTLALARARHPYESNKLNALCIRYGIDLSSRARRHGAIIDAKLLAKVYAKLAAPPELARAPTDTAANMIAQKAMDMPTAGPRARRPLILAGTGTRIRRDRRQAR